MVKLIDWRLCESLIYEYLKQRLYYLLRFGRIAPNMLTDAILIYNVLQTTFLVGTTVTRAWYKV